MTVERAAQSMMIWWQKSRPSLIVTCLKPSSFSKSRNVASSGWVFCWKNEVARATEVVRDAKRSLLAAGPLLEHESQVLRGIVVRNRLRHGSLRKHPCLETRSHSVADGNAGTNHRLEGSVHFGVRPFNSHAAIRHGDFGLAVPANAGAAMRASAAAPGGHPRTPRPPSNARRPASPARTTTATTGRAAGAVRHLGRAGLFSRP